jgi:hypothetical protein
MPIARGRAWSGAAATRVGVLEIAVIAPAVNRPASGRVEAPGSRPTGASVPRAGMHHLRRSLVLAALTASLAAAPACKRNNSATDTAPGTATASDGAAKDAPKRARRPAGMPRPLRLPADAPIVIHVQAPGQALAGLQAYAPQLPEGRTLLQELVSQLASAGELEQQLAGAIDLERPFDVASVDGQLIVHVPILPARVESVATLLADKPPMGRFGAVDLQRGAVPGPKLAWLDRESSTLTLADDERGLATGRHLAKAYGEQPLRVQLQGAEARKYAPQLLLERLDVRGAGVHDFELEAKGVPPETFAQLEWLQAGALTGLLESPRIAVGASSKYTHHERDVKRLLSDLNRQVDRQNFLVKGTLEDLLRRFGSVARSWNGRTMVGVGPKNHVLLGMGAHSSQKMGGALFHLLNGVLDNLELARSIGLDVPKIRFQRNKASAAGSNISVVALEDARSFLPPEARSLIDGRGDLRIAVAFPERSGAGLVVIGPDCSTVLGHWLEDIAEATPASESQDHFVSATLAVEPAAVEPVLANGGDLTALLGLSAAREPTRITVARSDDLVKVRVQGPAVEYRPRRVGPHVSRPGGRVSEAKAAPTGKPARVQPAASKPIR